MESESNLLTGVDQKSDSMKKSDPPIVDYDNINLGYLPISCSARDSKKILLSPEESEDENEEKEIDLAKTKDQVLNLDFPLYDPE